jgi:hypothetical protein
VVLLVLLVLLVLPLLWTQLVSWVVEQLRW